MRDCVGKQSTHPWGVSFSNGKSFQADGVEVNTKWAYPPYGGMVYYQDGQKNTKEDLKKRCEMNTCFLPVVEGEGTPVYGEMSGYTESVQQKRIMIVTDDYIVLFDHAKGNNNHIYDSLMQIKGFQSIEGNAVKYLYHTEQMNDNPVSDAQFITDCSWYGSEDTTVEHFSTIFTEEMAGERLICDCRITMSQEFLTWMCIRHGQRKRSR
jgi:hypothetical protein